MNGFMVHHGHTIPYMMKHRSHLDTSTHASAGKQVVSAKEGMEIEISFRSLNILSCLLIGPRLPIPYATVSAPKKYLGGVVLVQPDISHPDRHAARSFPATTVPTCPCTVARYVARHKLPVRCGPTLQAVTCYLCRARNTCSGLTTLYRDINCTVVCTATAKCRDEP